MIEFPRDGIDSNAVDTDKTVDVLLRLASSARTYRSADGRLHAQVPVGDRLEMYGLKSAGFRDWLIDGYFSYRGAPASPWAIRRVISLLEARARFDGQTPSVFIRVGHDGPGPHYGSNYFLDLGDSSGRAIQISTDGWSMIERPGVHFRRPEGLLPLPVPTTDGSIDLLRPYVNLTDVDFRLMIAWLTAAMRPTGPYPILVLQGEQGSSKSTLARIMRFLIDPHVCPLLAEPKSTRDLMVTALDGWLLAYDNLTAIPGWMSDALCQLVFGGGFSGRALYSNDERSIIHAQRPVLLNGIEDFVRRGDLRDRCVFLQLPPIVSANRRAEYEFWRSFEADYPRILGGVLDLIVRGMQGAPVGVLRRLAAHGRLRQVGRRLGNRAELANRDVSGGLQRQPPERDRHGAGRFGRRIGRSCGRFPRSTLGGHAGHTLRSTHRSRWQESRSLGPLAQIHKCVLQ